MKRLKRCNTCKFWTREKDTIIGDCICPKFVYSGDGQSPDTDGLGYWDYESYKAGFDTGQEFGCIHHTR